MGAPYFIRMIDVVDGFFCFVLKYVCFVRLFTFFEVNKQILDKDVVVVIRW